ncbi:MAG: NifB/NifX family molybdenum-iron cluster-binding protein [Chloroflexi bacterium]|nr:NifB/NifX family molybdenum-iron cluster-binding protein [Chloroflexota bacterium]
MRIAVTTSEPKLDAPVDPRFADAPFILMVDLDSMECVAYENPAAQPLAGHGMIAARFVALQGANAVISGDYCPHGFAALRSIGVQLYTPSGSCSVAEVVVQLQQGELESVAAPTGHGHHHNRAHHADREDARGSRPLRLPMM